MTDLDRLLAAGDALAKSGVKIFNSGQAMKTSRATYANQAHLVSAWQKRWRALARSAAGRRIPCATGGVGREARHERHGL